MNREELKEYEGRILLFYLTDLSKKPFYARLKKVSGLSVELESHYKDSIPIEDIRTIKEVLQADEIDIQRYWERKKCLF